MDPVQDAGGCSSNVKEAVVGRRSSRKRKAVVCSERETETSPKPKMKKMKNTTSKPFCCDNCSSRFVVNPLRRKPGQKSKGKATPRHVRDPESQKLLTLCNACGLKMERKSKTIPRDPPPSAEDKKRYYESAEHFAASLVEGLGEPDAEKLTCPVYNTKPCGCIQKFIIGEGDREQSKKRALQLLSILKDAKRLREKKFYNREEVLSKGKGQRKVGLGNGHRKAKEYEDFVLSNRKILRGSDLRMCERATQRILLYSNNFLHKRLKTDPLNRTQRLERTKGRAALGKLVDVSQLPEQTCCSEKCVLLARTHGLLLKQWRERATSGQLEARKVLAEMLTPSGQGSNCARFIAMVTGSSITTIARVKDQMWKTGGDREPPQHGLKKYWKNHPKSKTSLLEEDGRVRGSRAGSSDAGTGQVGGAQGSLMTVAQLIEQQDQLKRLQQQLEEQQQQVRQQQRLVEQQLVQHQLRQSRHVKQQAALVEAQRKVSNQRRAGSTKSSASNTNTTLPPAQNLSTNIKANQSNVQVQPVSADQQGRIYMQPPVSTSQPARSTATQPQPSNQQVPTIVGLNVESPQMPVQQQQTLPQGTQPSQQQQHHQQHQQQQPLTATVAGLEGIDAKLLQQNLQQILAELQNQMVTQQIHQQLMNCGIQQPQGGQSGTSQLPSYSTAVAATNHAQVIQAPQQQTPQQPPQQQQQQHHQRQQQQQQQQQQQKTPKDSSQHPQIIIQAIPNLHPNLLLSSNGQGLPGSSNVPQYISTSTSGSLARLKAADNSHVMVPITLHPPGNHSAGEETVNVEDVNVQLQEVVMPLSNQDAEACNMVLPRQQQLPTILQGTLQQHLPNLGHLASHSSESGTTRPTTTTISIESLCSNQQTSSSNMGDLVVAEVEDAATRMMPGGEESIPSTIPLVGGVSVETLLSPEALHLLNSTGQASLNVSLSSTRNIKQSSSGSGTM